MTEADKLEFFKQKGFTYDPMTGFIISHKKNIIKSKNENGYIYCSCITDSGKRIQVLGHRLAWYLYYNHVPVKITHINRNKADNKIDNLRHSFKQPRPVPEFQNILWIERLKRFRVQHKKRSKITIIGYTKQLKEAIDMYNNYLAKII